MNIFFRLGEWWESRRKIRTDEFHEFEDRNDARIDALSKNLKALDLSIRESQTIPASIANELKAMRIRIDQRELFVGLKREKKPEAVPGMARIK